MFQSRDESDSLACSLWYGVQRLEMLLRACAWEWGFSSPKRCCLHVVCQVRRDLKGTINRQGDFSTVFFFKTLVRIGSSIFFVSSIFSGRKLLAQGVSEFIV